MDKPLRSTEEIIIQGRTLKEILDLHHAWYRTGAEEGKRADLSEFDLSGADLSEVNLSETNLSRANLSGANLSRAALMHVNLSGAKLNRANLSGAFIAGANLLRADLSGANMHLAYLSETNLYSANLSGANLSGANLCRADLCEANLSEANLSEANLSQAVCIETNFTNANIENSRIFGISVWDVKVDGLKQKNLIITKDNEPEITVDSIEVAQFIYLILNNKKIRDVLDTITSKVVLILGRFTTERKIVLDALRDELRQNNYTPIVFDFDKPTNKNLTETVSTLAHMARFVIADITDAKSIPQELQRIVPGLPSLPVQPIILDVQYEYSMFKDFLDYPWVLLPHRYSNLEDLLESLSEKVVRPALAKSKEIENRRRMIEEELSGK